MSDILKDAAVRVGACYGALHSEEKEFALSPETILVFMEIIKEVVQLWAKCKKNGEEAKAIADNPGPLQKILLRRRVESVLGRRVFRERGEQTIAAILAAGEEASVDFLEKLIEEG